MRLLIRLSVLVSLLLMAKDVVSGDVSLARGQLLLTTNHSGWGRPNCQSCHLLRRIHANAPHIRGIVRNKGYNSCAGCHGDNGTGQRRPCLLCHNSHDLPASPEFSGTHRHDFRVGADRAFGDRDCLVCHRSADMDGYWEPAIDLTRFSGSQGGKREAAFCLRCHNDTHQHPQFPVQARRQNDSLVTVENDWNSIDRHGPPAGSSGRFHSGLRPPYRYGQELRCTDCHAMHGTDNPHLLIDHSGKGVFRLPFRSQRIRVDIKNGDYSQLCVLCHRMDAPVGDALLDTGNGLSGVHLVNTDCSRCHTHHRPGGVKVSTTDVSLAHGQLVTTPRHSGWGKSRCVSCHLIDKIHDNAPHIRDIVRAKGYETCTACHGTNGTEAPRHCLICHNSQDLPASPIQTGVHTHDFTTADDLAPTDEDCLTCHEASDMDGVRELDIDLTLLPDAGGVREPYRHESDFCLRCHNRNHQLPGQEIVSRDYLDTLVAIEDAWQYIDVHGHPRGSGERTYAGLRPPYRYGTVVGCTHCHAMHGTDNPNLIIDSTLKGVFDLGFRLQNLPITVFEPGDYSQLCVMCHDMTVPIEDALTDTGNGLSGVHQVGGDCTHCHTHGKAAQVGL